MPLHRPLPAKPARGYHPGACTLAKYGETDKRRHLDASQRAMIAETFWKLESGQNVSRAKLPTSAAPASVEDVAAEFKEGRTAPARRILVERNQSSSLRSSIS